MVDYFVTFKVILYVLSFILFWKHFIIRKCYRNTRLVEFSKTLPGPIGLPLVGNTLPFVFSGLGGVDRILRQYTRTYGSIYKIWLGNELVIGLSNVEYLETVFRSMKTLSRPTILFNGYKETFGTSLFTSTVPLWRKTRKRLQPFFGKNIVKVQTPLLQEFIEKYINLMKHHVNGPEFNVKNYMHEMVIDSFLGTYYNIHLTSKQKEALRFREILISSSTYAFSKMIFPWLRINCISKLYFLNQKEWFENKLKDFFSMLKFVEPDKLVGILDDNGFDIFLLEACKKLAKSLLYNIQKLEEDIKTENYVFNESSNFIIAVMGTTATTISSCLLAIAMHPDIQSKLFNELKEEFVHQYDLSKLKYLDQVINETQRRFTVIKNIFREVEEDITIDSMIIPKRAVIMIRIVDIHMNPSFYSNPEEFNPENFSAEAVKKRSKYSHLPHSLGIRDCIGKHLARCIIKLTIINFLQNFKLSTTTQMKDIDYTGAVYSEKRKGYWIKIERRQHR